MSQPRSRVMQQPLKWLMLLCVVITPLLFSACGGGASSSDTTQVTYSFPTFTNLPDVQQVQDALNAILKPKLNVTLKLNPIDSASYDQKEKLAFASGQQCDIVFTAPWTNNYYVNVAQGNLLALDDLLPKNAPKTYASMPQTAWNAAKVNGKIYGVINQQTWVRQYGIAVRKDMAEKYHLDLNSVNNFSDLTPFLAAIKAGETGMTPAPQGVIYNASNLGYDIVDGVSTDQGVLGINADDPSLKVTNLATLPAFANLVTLAHQWYKAGYLPSDDPGDQITANWQAGKYAMQFGGVNADTGSVLKRTFGFDFVTKPFGQAILTTNNIIATMNGICQSSAHPDAALKVLEEFNTNPTVYHLIADGIEGKHYVVKDSAHNVIDFPKGVTAASNGYNPNTPWMFGNLFNDFYKDESALGAFPAMLKANQAATPSLAIGFSFDPNNVKTELAQVQQAQKQYGDPLINGRVDPTSGISQYVQKLKDAGIDKVIAELQKQLDAFKAKKN